MHLDQHVFRSGMGLNSLSDLERLLLAGLVVPGDFHLGHCDVWFGKCSSVQWKSGRRLTALADGDLSISLSGFFISFLPSSIDSWLSQLSSPSTDSRLGQCNAHDALSSAM